MVLCNPTKNFWGLNYKPLEDYKNDNFILQHNSWFGSYRILLHCPVLKNSYLVAWATKRKEIVEDWDLLQIEFNSELIRVGQNLNEQSLLTFIQHLVTSSSPPAQDSPSSPTHSASSINSPVATSPEPQKISLLHAAKTNKINNKSQLAQFLKDGDISLQETDECGRTLLHFLSRISSSDKENLELIKFAIQRGACIDSKDTDNWTPLHCACYAGNLSLVELYLKSGAPLFSITRDGTLPFVYLVRKMYDSESERTKQYKLFLEMVNMGVSVNTQNLRGETPLHGAVISQNIYTLKWLLEHNADPNIANKNNELPLHYVARFGNLEMAKLLIEKKSDPVAKSLSGTPLDVATFHNRLEIAEYLVGVIESTSQFEDNIEAVTTTPAPSPPPPPPVSEPKTVPMSPKTITRNRYKTVEVMQQLGMQSPDDHSNASPPISESILLSPKKNAVVPHSFHIRQFSRPTWCEYCNGFIFGMLRQGYTCESCGYTVHHTCKKSALFWEECRKKEEESNTLEVVEPSVDTPDMSMTRSSSRRSSISSSSGKELPLTSSVLMQPYLAYFDAKELDVIYHQFQCMDIDQDGYIKEQEFIDCIGIMCDLPFAQAMYSLLDEERDNKIDFMEFLTAMTILFKGSPHEQLAFSFGLFSPDELYVTRDNFSRVIESFAKTFEQVNVEEFVQNTFDKADTTKRGKITTEEWISMAMSNYVYIQSLGLLHEENSCENSHCSTNHMSKNSLLVQYIQAEMSSSSGKRKGIPISFGHHSWDICYHMMLGMRHAVQDVLKSEEKPLEAKDYELHIDKSLSSNKQEEWVFRDYAGHVFRHIRKLSKIDTAGYMFSLGPEKILGNLLLGNFDSLCELASTGRSGSFFFKSTDNKYLIKTLPLEELMILQRILPAYLEYLESNPNSFLTRIFGLHSLKKASAKEIQFTVMENLFDSPLPVQEQYDLKGSTVGRHVELEGPDPEIALKDNDFKRRINLGTKMKAQMLEQIENDTKFLEKQGICDYSFLVGYHFLSDADREYIQKLEKIFPKDARDSVFRQYFGGILSEDKTEVYFMGIIDLLTTYNYKKMGEYFAKSFLHDSTQISAIRPTPYRNRFLKYMSTIVD